MQVEKSKPQARSRRSQKTYQLRLYVAGQTPKSLAAFANLKKICEEHMPGQYRNRSHRPAEEAAAGKRRPDPCHPNPGEEITAADQEDHRRSLQYRTRPRRTGLA